MSNKSKVWKKTHRDKLETVFKHAWETDEKGLAYLTFIEDLPEKLKGYGLADSRIELSEYVFYKLIGKHKLSEEEILSVKEAFGNPVAILRNKDKVIIVTDIADYNSFPITIVLAANEGNSNYIASIYGRKNIVGYMYSHTMSDDVLFMDLDKIECIKGNREDANINKRLDEIKKNILQSRGCKLKMTIERNGEKIELTENEIWAAYSLVNDNITKDVEQEAEQILAQEYEMQR